MSVKTPIEKDQWIVDICDKGREDGEEGGGGNEKTRKNTYTMAQLPEMLGQPLEH